MPYLFLTQEPSLTGDGMRIGILADTHDNLPLVNRAVERLNAAGPGLVDHHGPVPGADELAIEHQLGGSISGRPVGQQRLGQRG